MTSQSPTDFNVAQAAAADAANAKAALPATIGAVVTTAVNAAVTEAQQGGSSAGTVNAFNALGNGLVALEQAIASMFGGPVVGEVVNVVGGELTPILIHDLANMLGGLFKHIGISAPVVSPAMTALMATPSTGNSDVSIRTAVNAQNAANGATV